MILPCLVLDFLTNMLLNNLDRPVLMFSVHLVEVNGKCCCLFACFYQHSSKLLFCIPQKKENQSGLRQQMCVNDDIFISGELSF